MDFTIITNPELIGKDKWSEFVNNHSYGNIFQTPEMYEVYNLTSNYNPIFISIINKSSNNIMGLLLAVLQTENKGFWGRFSSRVIIEGGPLIINRDKQVLNLILLELSKIINKRAIYTQFRNFWDWGELKDSFLSDKYIFENHLNILIDISIGKDKLWKNIKSNRKEGIRKADRQKFTFEVSNNIEDIDLFYDLLTTSYKKIKLPFPKIHFFKNIINKLPFNSKLFILKKYNTPIVVLFAVNFKNILYAYYIGIDYNNEFLILRPVDYLYWKVIEWGTENGFTIYDWMGAGKPNKEYGVRKFKLQYGGKLVDYGRFVKIHKRLLHYFGIITLKLLKIIPK